MDESTKQTVDKYEAKLAAILAQARKIKIAINGLYELEDEPLPYPDADKEAQGQSVRRTTIRPDQFFGRPLATVVREILNARNQRDEGAIALDDLFALMNQGGFELEGRDEITRKRTLAITISKNPAFIKVPNSGHIGLAEWYPNAKKKTAPSNGNGNHDDGPDPEELLKAQAKEQQERDDLAAQQKAVAEAEAGA